LIVAIKRCTASRVRRLLALFLLAGCGSSKAETPLAPLVVQTADGPVRGEIARDDERGTEARVFRGIPYAAPPLGDLRFRAPQPSAPWTEEKDATRFSKACAQVLGIAPLFDDRSSEDCLYANVWTPSRPPATPLPVMVWIHGGAFLAGAASDTYYDAAHFVAATGVVVVSFNYRLGPFGFLGHPAVGGNFGLLDQRAALEWVKRNAAAFGGDPANITAFGESAGGVSIALHLLSPETSALFNRAAIESGPPSLVGLGSMDDATKMADDLARAVGCAPADIACLRAKPASQLATALHWAKEPIGGSLEGSVPVAVWWPIVDGVVVKKPPEDSLREGAIAKMPLLLGTLSEEGGLFHSGLIGDIPLKSANDYVPSLQRAFGDAATAIAARYPATGAPDLNRALAHITTLSSFTCPIRRFARASAQAGNPTYLYQMTRPSHGGSLSTLGPVHASDLAYLFDNTTALTGGPGDDGVPLAHAMESYWSRFGRTSDPNGAPDPAWPRFAATDEAHLVLDVPITEGAHLAKDDCDFWDTMPAPKLVTY
jgi:para-nitrobenzyl esterase